jgi:FkbM family methyltransferase
MKIISRVIGWMRSVTWFIIGNSVRLIIAFSLTRRVLNAVYFQLTPYQRSLFHQKFAKLFRSRFVRGRNGIWKVFFQKKGILMPLTSERFWLDWDSAVSIIGHEIEVKQTYGALIGSSEAPELFIDIGANYGTHSLLFLVHHIKTITFEPNASCHDYFKQICKLNGVIPQLEPVALGEKDGYVELSYPERDTWLGSTNPKVKKKLASTQKLITERVKQKKIDDYVPQIEHYRTLIKIDTEGNELSVLRGAIKTLQGMKPTVIFECWSDSERAELFNFFSSQNYKICHLPWKPMDKTQSLKPNQFIASSSTNFVALPIAKLNDLKTC